MQFLSCTYVTEPSYALRSDIDWLIDVNSNITLVASFFSSIMCCHGITLQAAAKLRCKESMLAMEPGFRASVTPPPQAASVLPTATTGSGRALFLGHPGSLAMLRHGILSPKELALDDR
jgi:hypothetical protein